MSTPDRRNDSAGNRALASHAALATDNEILGLSAALSDIMATAGYQAIIGLLERERDAFARRFVMDDTTTKDYARGYLAGLGYLLAQIPELLDMAQEIRAEAAAAGGFIDTRIAGGGNGSLA